MTGYLALYSFVEEVQIGVRDEEAEGVCAGMGGGGRGGG